MPSPRGTSVSPAGAVGQVPGAPSNCWAHAVAASGKSPLAWVTAQPTQPPVWLPTTASVAVPDAPSGSACPGG